MGISRLDLNVVLAVGEALEGHLREREAHVRGDFLGQGGVGAAWQEIDCLTTTGAGGNGGKS